MSVDEELPGILVCDVGANFPMEIAECVGEQGYELLSTATEKVPSAVLRLLDRVSRHWLVRNNSLYLEEIEALANLSRSPGLYYLNLDYEWGCTTAARPGRNGHGAVLQRTLDWNVNGIGRHIVAARIANPLGNWVSLTWPAFTGVIQAFAPGRFAAAINQPTPARRFGVRPLDRLLAKTRVWGSRSIQPIHLLRRVFETAPDYATARAVLETTPITTPVIFTLAGIHADQTIVIERRPAQARIIDDAFAANEWRANEWRSGQHAAFQNAARLAAMRRTSADWDLSLGWVGWPLLNDETRLAMMADPANGHLLARGYEAGKAATKILSW